MAGGKFGSRQPWGSRPGIGKRSGNRIVVVAYDGQATEDEYFKGWRRVLGPAGITLEPIYVRSGGNVCAAVREAIKASKRQREHDEFWCVCDVDDSTEKNVADAIALAAANKIKLCLSRRSFEVWLGLHYAKSDKVLLDEAEAISLVKKHYQNYGPRNKIVPFDELLPKTEQACLNAEWLAGRGCKDPATAVHVLARILLAKYAASQKKC